jgi:hypothetical protein
MPSFIQILLPTKYMRIGAQVDVPNLVYGLKRAPKVCGCYLVCSHVPQLLLIKFTQ